MRLFGHPVHTMLLHFPVALWPAHGLLHVFASRLPAGVAAIAGFWILMAGTGLGWVAAAFGACDLLAISRDDDGRRLSTGVVHASINGAVLIAFTCLLAAEYASYPAISHGAAFLWVEFALLCAMGVGNYFGGTLVWGPGRPPNQA